MVPQSSLLPFNHRSVPAAQSFPALRPPRPPASGHHYSILGFIEIHVFMSHVPWRSWNTCLSAPGLFHFTDLPSHSGCYKDQTFIFFSWVNSFQKQATGQKLTHVCLVYFYMLRFNLDSVHMVEKLTNHPAALGLQKVLGFRKWMLYYPLKTEREGEAQNTTVFLRDNSGAGPGLFIGCPSLVLLFYTLVHYLVHNGILKSIV